MARRKDKMVWASVDDTLRAWIVEQAEKKGLSLAAYVRLLLLQAKDLEENKSV